MTEPNKDDIAIETRSLGERLTTTRGGMYKLAHCNNFLMIFIFIYEVPQVNVLPQAHDFQISDSFFCSANTVSNWLVSSTSSEDHWYTIDQY